MNYLNLIPAASKCLRHDFELDATGHVCRRCGLREELVNGQKFVFDPFMPQGEVRLKQDGLTLGRIIGL